MIYLIEDMNSHLWLVTSIPMMTGWDCYGGFHYSGTEGLTDNSSHADTFNDIEAAEKRRLELIQPERFIVKEHELNNC